MKDGDTIPMQYIKCYLVGIPGVGKTTTLKRLIKKPIDSNFSRSTTMESTPVKAITTDDDSDDSSEGGYDYDSDEDSVDSTEKKQIEDRCRLVATQQYVSIKGIAKECNMSSTNNELEDVIELFHCTDRSKTSTIRHEEAPQSESARSTESAELHSEVSTEYRMKSSSALALEEILVPGDIEKMVSEFNEQLRKRGGDFSGSKGVRLILMTDVGGQSAFLEMLPLLMKGPSIYLTFFKLSEDPFKDRYSDGFRVDPDNTFGNKEALWTVGDVIIQILSNVALSRYPSNKVKELLKTLKTEPLEKAIPDKDTASSAEESSPPTKKFRSSINTSESKHDNHEHQVSAFLIGTFKDQLSLGDKTLDKKLIEIDIGLRKKIKEVFGDLKKHFIAYRSKRPKSSRLMFSLDKSSDDEEMKKLRSRIMKETEKVGNFKVPVRWLLFGLILRKEYEWVTMEDCEHIAEMLHIRKKNVKELLSFLSSVAGMLLYHPDSCLKGVVICNLQTIFTSISKLIVGDIYSTEKKTWKQEIKYVKHLGGGKFCRNDMEYQGETLKKSRRRSDQDLEPIPIDDLLEFLSYCHIIAHDESESKCFIMPAALDHSSLPGEDLAKLKEAYPCEMETPCPLFIKFNFGYTPPGLFSCLITTLYGKGKMVTNGVVKRNFISFVEDGTMIALIAYSQWYEVHVISDKYCMPLKGLCIKVKKAVRTYIREVIERLGFCELSTPCELKLLIKCNLKSEHFINVDDKKSEDGCIFCNDPCFEWCSEKKVCCWFTPKVSVYVRMHMHNYSFSWRAEIQYGST